MDDDGVALFSMAHPRPAWWKRLYWWFRCLRGIRGATLEHAEIEVKTDRPRLKLSTRN